MQLTYLEAIRQGIWEEMDHDPTVFCLGEDIGIYGGAFKVTDVFFEHKYLYRRIKEEVPAEDYVVPIGKARVAREGTDLSIITYAAMVHTALEAAEILKKDGIDLEIVDLRTVSPLDREAIVQTVKKTNKVIVLHEHSRTGGLAGEIAAIINEQAFDDLDGPIIRIAGLDSAIPFSPPQEHHYLPKVEDVVRESRRLKAY